MVVYTVTFHRYFPTWKIQKTYKNQNNQNLINEFSKAVGYKIYNTWKEEWGKVGQPVQVVVKKEEEVSSGVLLHRRVTKDNYYALTMSQKDRRARCSGTCL